MIGREELRELWATLSANKLRTALTGFAVGWGILLLVILLSAGTGVSNGIRGTLARAGMTSREVNMRSGFISEPVGALPRWYRPPFTMNEYNLLCQLNSADISEASPYLDGWANIEVKGVVQEGAIQGVQSRYAEIHPIKWSLPASRFINERDEEEARKVIVISKHLAEALFSPWQEVLGSSVLLDGVGFRVIGIYEGANGLWSNNYLPLRTMQMLFHRKMNKKPTALSGMLMICPKVDSEADVEALATQFRRQLAPIWSCSAEDKRILRLRSSFVEQGQVQQIVLAIDVFLWIIGLSTLVIGLVGVINIMQISVSERRREIGVRKALGAKPRDIIAMILTESLILTLIAGLVGLVVGVWTMKLIVYLMSLWSTDSSSQAEMFGGAKLFVDPTITLGTAIGAMVVMVLGGLLAGFLPARRAVRIPVVEAMRR